MFGDYIVYFLISYKYYLLTSALKKSINLAKHQLISEDQLVFIVSFFQQSTLYKLQYLGIVCSMLYLINCERRKCIHLKKNYK